MKDKILSDLVSNAKYYDLLGVEFTDEDVNCVQELITTYGKSYDDAIDICLTGIKDVLSD